MVKPLYIVFFFFALSLCKEECVTLTLGGEDEVKECKLSNESANIEHNSQTNNGIPPIDPTQNPAQGQEGNQDTEKVKKRGNAICRKLLHADNNTKLQKQTSGDNEKYSIDPSVLNLLTSELSNITGPNVEIEFTSGLKAETDNPKTLKLCYEVTDSSSINQRVLKNKENNPHSNRLPKPADRPNQNFKGSLIMAI